MIQESQLKAENAIFSQSVSAGDYFFHTIKQGQTMRLVDLKGNQAADTLFYNANDVS